MRKCILSMRVTSDEKKDIEEAKKKLKIKSMSEFLRYLWLRFGIKL